MTFFLDQHRQGPEPERERYPKLPISLTKQQAEELSRLCWIEMHRISDLIDAWENEGNDSGDPEIRVLDARYSILDDVNMELNQLFDDSEDDF